MVNINNEKISLLTCSDEVKKSLVDYSLNLRDILGDNLVSISIYGSLARACFHPETSDVDMIVVMNQQCSKELISTILECHQGIDIPIDAVFVTYDQLLMDTSLPPVEFVIKPMPAGPQGVFSGICRDFLVKRQDAYEAAVATAGTDPQKLFKPVPWELLSQCMQTIFPDIVTRFKNPVLMLCRFVYTHAQKKLCSKRIAGEWAMRNFAIEWLPMIETALVEYSLGTACKASLEQLSSFEKYCEAYIKDALSV